MRIRKGDGALYTGISNPNATAPLEKMVIVNQDKEEEIAVLYNPQSYKQQKTVKYSRKSPIGSNAPIVQFLYDCGETLTFDLFFDSLYAGAEVGGADKDKFADNSVLASIDSKIDIRDYTKKVYNLTKIEPSVHRPPELLVMWSSLQFHGYLSRCQQEFIKFNELGKPIRAILHCTFIQKVDIDKSSSTNPLESPDTTKYRRIKAGDALCSIAVEEYGQAETWREIAKANHIANPRILRTGDMIRVPALKR